MSVTDFAVWVLRGVGALWIVGAGVLLWQLWRWRNLDRMVDDLEKMTADAAAQLGEPHTPSAPVDRGRDVWMALGGVCLLAAGALMAAAHVWAVAALGVLIVQQLAYFIRQRGQELKAKNAGSAEDARPARSTINAFFFSLIMAVLAAWLYREGALWGG